MSHVMAGEAATQILKDWNVDHIYGMPGDSINEFVEYLRQEKNEIDFIQVRHEEVGALAASAYAKLTGNIGACLSIGGPGAIHLLNGLYDAKADGAPVLVLAGQVPTTEIGMDAFQEVDLTRLFDDVAVFNQRVPTPDSFPKLLNQAIRSAYTYNGVAVLVLPDNITSHMVKEETEQTSSIYSVPMSRPADSDVKRAVTSIENATRPVILAGNGTKKARQELEKFAEKIKAPIIFTLPSKGVLADTHPYNLGQLGDLGTKPAYHAVQDADILIMIGTSYPYRDYLPESTPAIQIDNNPDVIGKRYPVHIGLAGDTGETLTLLLEEIQTNSNSEFLNHSQREKMKWDRHLEEVVNNSKEPLKAPYVISQLSQVIEDHATVSVDVGNVTVWMARYFPFTHHKFVISSWMATMGCGLPGAIAGKLAYPDRQSIAVCGDGGFSMIMHDFLTALKYELPIMVVILNNSQIAMITSEQEEAGNPSYETNLENMDFALFAEACGGVGYRVDHYKEVSSVFEKASKEVKPVIVDVRIKDEKAQPGHTHQYE
ncbi:pyruvate oxidase [Alteribacillus iranensis]|uniref:Pyruvate oxidase n=1 Tax=Alteribacillus iranensis TaxID=930128 RepID=A0A1I2EMF9_9BACI|nr:pyruvate oxidase [Alteribacillus iranensis]SFE94055.1 pyruvate oxidase [Alteribacillus iranensis]